MRLLSPGSVLTESPLNTMANVTPPKDDNWFIRNAIYCWLNYFGEEHQWHAKYTELAQRETYLPKPRPAKRRKTTNATTKTTTE